MMMNSIRFAVLAALTLSVPLALSGCQALTGFYKIDNPDDIDVAESQLAPIEGEINIACKGTYHCEIMQIDETPIISAESHEPVDPRRLTVMRLDESKSRHTDSAHPNAHSDPPAGQLAPDTTPLSGKSAIKIVPLAPSNISGLTNYYTRLNPGKHEVQVNFYPENNVGYIERFAIIHEFMTPGSYELRAYRKMPSKADSSLLDTASPDPLCVDLTYNGQLQLQFCKQGDADRQGEFFEMTAIDAS